MARLKVFKARMGFFDSVVAAPSRKAALEAWGARQDLFQEGLAEPTDEPEAVEAALQHPGLALRRAVGASGSYAEEAAPPQVPAAPQPRQPRPKPAARDEPPADRTALTKAEQALEAAEKDQATERSALQQEREAVEARLRELEDRQGRLEDAFAVRRRKLQAALDKARRTYQRAGGR